MARKQPEAARRDFGLARDIAMQLPPGNPDQSNIMSQYIAAMRILDPKSLEAPPASATPISVPVPVASATPVTPTNTTVGNTTAPPVNVTAPVNGTNP